MVSVLNVGGNIRVNTTGGSDQIGSPNVATTASGGYVIVWDNDDGSYAGISMQRYDAASHRLGTEVIVNTYTTGDQFEPVVTGLSDGSWVVAWDSNGQDGSGYGVYEQRFDLFGNRIGSPSLVNTTTANDQLVGGMTGLADGGYLVTWSSDANGTNYDVYAARYDANGTRVSGDIFINTTTPGNQFNDTVTGLSDGGFVVAWQGPDASGAGIYKQQYNAFGIAVGMETRVNTTTAADQSNPCVALLADGGYVIAWDSMVTGGYDIFFQRYDASGNAMGQETDVGAVSNLYSNPPSVTGLSDGGFALAFDLVVDGKSAAVVQRYDDESTLIGPGIVLGRTATDYTSGVYTGGMQESPSVSALADGGFIATWATDDIVSGYTTLGIHSTIFAAALSTSGSQVLYGTSGADVMDGGSGADVMYGGQGDDVYVVDNIGDVIGENPGEGEDTVESYISYTLGDNVENLTLMGSAGLSGTGNELANTIIGNNGANTLTGGDGNDYIDGGKGNDILDGGNKNDTLEGGDGDDTIYASAGGDTVDGGAGFDWYDASTLSSGLTISLASGRVSGAGMSAELSSIEKVNGTSGNDIITGSANADVLRGNLGDDIIDGGTGDDHLFGDGGTNTASYASATAAVTVSLALQNSDQDTIGAGTDYLNGFANLTGSKYNDTLTGDNNNNLLDGGAGADVMKGGLGDDTYVVGNAYDNVGERLNEGTDTVLSSITYTLTSNVENLTLTGTADINAIGNSINNTLYGNAGNNLLDGAAGADKMYGGLGNDTYVVNNSFDQANENANEGTDTVQSSITFTLGANVENLTLTGTAAINGTGNALANIIAGNAGNNILKGGAGADTFVFGKFGVGNGLDHLVDFVSATDHLSFTGADYGIAAGHVLTAGELSTTGSATSAAGVGQFVYNSTTHTLSWDANGLTAGGVTDIAVFDNGNAPASGDFLFS